MKRDILYYGLIGALVILLVKGADYNLFSKHITIEIYTSILIVLFTALGLWYGLRYTSTKIIVEQVSVDKLDQNHLLANGISEREYQILNLILAGRTNKEIAHELYISISTVKSHLQKTYQKLGVKNRTQATLKAKQLSISTST